METSALDASNVEKAFETLISGNSNLHSSLFECAQLHSLCLPLFCLSFSFFHSFIPSLSLFLSFSLFLSLSFSFLHTNSRYLCATPTLFLSPYAHTEVFTTAQKKVEAGEEVKAQPTSSKPIMLASEQQAESNPSGCAC